MYELAAGGLLSTRLRPLLPFRLVSLSVTTAGITCTGKNAQLTRKAKKFVNLSLLR